MATRTIRPPHELRIWEKIELSVGSGPDSGRYLARIQDTINGGIVITEPVYAGGSALLREDAEITVTVTREDAVYEFRSRVKRLNGGKANQVVFTPPQQLLRVQRRRFVRVELIRRVSYAILGQDLDWTTFPQRLYWKSSQSVDLSGGGARFRVDDPLSQGTLVLLKLDLPESLNMPMAIFGLVRRCYHHHVQTYCGVEFLTAEQLHGHVPASAISQIPKELMRFDAHAQNRLVNFVFNVQIDLRRKGLL